MDFRKMNTANKKMALIATGGLGLWAIVALRTAARRSGSTLARSTTTLQSPITPRENETTLQKYMQQQPIQPTMQTQNNAVVDSEKRKRYEILWTDDWDFDSMQW